MEKNISHTPLHAAISSEIDPNKTFPAWIHGDGAPTNKVQGLFTISWGVVLARGSTATSRFIYTVMKESDIVDGTLEALFDDLAYNLNILLTGRYPENDRRGRKHPQAGQPINSTDWKLAVIFLKGDWEFLANIVHLPRWDNADNMCSSCSASNLENSNFLWTNPGADGWKSTKRNHTDFF